MCSDHTGCPWSRHGHWNGPQQGALLAVDFYVVFVFFIDRQVTYATVVNYFMLLVISSDSMIKLLTIEFNVVERCDLVFVLS